MNQLGQQSTSEHVIAHFSDTHFLGGKLPLHESVLTDEHLAQALAQLEASRARPEAIIFTGDLADLGEPDAYIRLRGLVDPVAERLGATVIWVMGNHDERLHFSKLLLDSDPTGAPQDRVYDIAGLRIIVLDTSVPGHGHGDLTQAQLNWLGDELATPAPHGTILAMHHPPIRTPLEEALRMFELQDQDRLAAVIRNTDVRAILAGHLHYSSHGTFAGVPVSVAAATCFTFNLAAEDRVLSGVNSGQMFNVVHLYDDDMVHSVVPIGKSIEITGHSIKEWAQIAASSRDQRL